MLAADKGLLKTTIDHYVNYVKRFYAGKYVYCISRFGDSHYLVGFTTEIIVWSESSDQEVLRISIECVLSIKRVVTTNNYIIKTEKRGVKVLTISDLK